MFIALFNYLLLEHFRFVMLYKGLHNNNSNNIIIIIFTVDSLAHLVEYQTSERYGPGSIPTRDQLTITEVLQ